MRRNSSRFISTFVARMKKKTNNRKHECFWCSFRHWINRHRTLSIRFRPEKEKKKTFLTPTNSSRIHGNFIGSVAAAYHILLKMVWKCVNVLVRVFFRLHLLVLHRVVGGCMADSVISFTIALVASPTHFDATTLMVKLFVHARLG